jgi:hypothetical protein
MFNLELLEAVKKLLRFEDSTFDDELVIYLSAIQEKLRKEGVRTPLSIKNNEMYVVCVAFETAQNIESLGISESRIKQLNDQYLKYIILLKDS